MYKTIRQGENSLQYTILPQQDEGRPGGLAVGHRKNGGGTRKRSILAYIGLFFVCAIITFAILIPLLVTSDLTPTAWFYRNQKVRDGKLLLGNVVPVKQSENHIVRGTPLRTVLLSSATVSTSTSTTTVAPTTSTMPAEHNGPLWSDALSVTEFQKLYKGDESIERTGDVLPLEQFPATTTTPRPFVVRDHQTTPGQQQSGTGNLLLARGRQRITASMSSTTVRPIPGQMQTQQQQQRSYPKHFSLQKHEKLTGADIPIQQQETKSIQVDTNREDMEKAHQNWLEAHWSYVDPYLRWKNYAADDRVVLPLILGVTLSMVVVIILMCYLVKRKRMCRMCKKSSANNNNRNSFENVEAQDGGEDHENLLTNDNQSEEE